MEVLKVNKFGQTYRTGTQAVQARCGELSERTACENVTQLPPSSTITVQESVTLCYMYPI